MTIKNMLVVASMLTVTSSVAMTIPAYAHGTEEEHATHAGLSETQKRQVIEKKAEIKAKLETAKAERVEKLATKKLEQCEKRQERINKLVEKSTERNQKHLAVFQKIEDKVKAFYEKKNITVAGYELAVANAEAKEAAAIAAIETSEEVTFDCATADAFKPGGEVKAAMQARHSALKEYRTAIKDLILVVKQHTGQNRESSSGTKPETESTGTEE